MSAAPVLVVGAGVSGLTTALVLSEAGYDVHVVTRDDVHETTSAAAGAFWFPYLVQPLDAAIAWSRVTYQHLERRALGATDSGARRIRFVEYLKDTQERPWWRDAVDQVDHAPEQLLPPGYVDGHVTMSITMDSRYYLDWLVRCLGNRGVTIERREITSLDQLTNEYELSINCSGLGARELCGDDSLYAVRGQVVRVAHNGWSDAVTDDCDDTFFYIVPRTDDIIVGGTHQVGDENLDIEERDTEQILERVAQLVPSFGAINVVGCKVGLRPARPSVRLEMERIGKSRVIHNYGHGGAGYTLSWGCATDVVALALGHS